MPKVRWSCEKKGCEWKGEQMTSWDPLKKNEQGELIRKFYCPLCHHKMQEKENKKKEPAVIRHDMAPELIGVAVEVIEVPETPSAPALVGAFCVFCGYEINEPNQECAEHITAPKGEPSDPPA